MADHCELLCLDLVVAEELRRGRIEADVATALARRAAAFADPTRLTLAAALAEAEELCVCDLAWIAERAQNLVSYHLRALRAEGIVNSRREQKMILYSLTDEGRRLLDAVLLAGAHVRARAPSSCRSRRPCCNVRATHG